MERTRTDRLVAQLWTEMETWDQQAFADQKESTEYELSPSEIIDLKELLTDQPLIAYAACGQLALEELRKEEQWAENMFDQDRFGFLIGQRAAGISHNLFTLIHLPGSEWLSESLPPSVVAQAVDMIIASSDEEFMEGQDG